MESIVDKGGLLLLLTIFMGIRIHWESDGAKISRQAFHDQRERMTTSAFALSMGILSLLWIFSDILGSFQVELPLFLRLIGVCSAIAGLLLLWQVHTVLGRNFSPRLELQSEHQLIEHGPYRWVRHPMYSSGFLFVVGCGLWTANWLQLGVPMGVFTLLVLLRINDEENMLKERFGGQWDEHCRRTGRIFPKFPFQRK